MADRTILHSDINSCYASIELLHHPELRGKPVAVGGDPDSRHGIVLASDQISKKFGVKTGMPLWKAKQICPNINFLPARMDLYLRFSNMAHEIYSEYSDLQQPYGIDESWIDVTESCSLKGDGYTMAKEISNRMKFELGITVSIGVSWNKIFAKLGSDYKKPDAITVISRENYKNIAWKLPVQDLLYVGRSTSRKLHTLGIHSIGSLANTSLDILKSNLGKMGIILNMFANGLDDSPVVNEYYHAPIKSIGNSTTTHRDLITNEDTKIVFFLLAESVSSRLRDNGFRCQGVEISIRNNELVGYTRQKKLENTTNITKEIATEAYSLFRANYNWSRPIRSLGVRAINLTNEMVPEQLNLFVNHEQREKQMQLDRVVDDIRSRFGFYSIQRGLVYQDRQLSKLNAKEDNTIHPHSYFN